jgi:hypothetical protein
MPYKDHLPATISKGPLIMGIGQGEFKPGWTQPHGDWKDLWGANYTWEDGTLAGLPKPNAFILKDITKWEQIVKKPDISGFDWEAAAKADLADVDRSKIAVTCDLGLQAFQQLVAFMGFNDTLCNLYENPQETKDLLNYLADWYVPVIEKILDYWKPEIVTMADDTAAKANPFFSVEMYQEFFKPIYTRITKPAKERGVFVDFHNCGHCEAFVPDMVDFGVNFWNPCQEENDLVAIQKKYGNKLAITGGWNYDIKLTDSEATVRGYVREYLDKYARNGGFSAFVFAGDFMAGPEEMAKWGPINGWLSDEMYTYGEAIYKR